jgi:hypothetical protein
MSNFHATPSQMQQDGNAIREMKKRTTIEGMKEIKKQWRSAEPMAWSLRIF